MLSKDPTSLAVVFICIVISITLHEMMHAFVSHWLGDTTARDAGRVSLNPLRHVDPFATILLPMITVFLFGVPLLAAKPVPFNPLRLRYGEFGVALVGIAGPLTNLSLAIFAGAFGYLLQGNIGVNLLDALGVFIAINVSLFVFNMIPIPPLDGSKVLFALLPAGPASYAVMVFLERYGIILIFAIALKL